eukprot:6431230-Amphidinium_carterae.2
MQVEATPLGGLDMEHDRQLLSQEYESNLEAKRLKVETMPTMSDLMNEVKSMRREMGDRVTSIENHQRGMSQRLERLEKDQVTEAQVKKLVTDAIATTRDSQTATNTTPRAKNTAPRGSGFKDRERGQRTTSIESQPEVSPVAVIGGFAADSRRKTLQDMVPAIMKHVASDITPIECYAPSTHGSILLVRFEHQQAMWSWIRSARTKTPFLVAGKALWFGPSRSKSERDRNRRLRDVRTKLANELRKTEESFEISWGTQQIWLTCEPNDLCLVQKSKGQHGPDAALNCVIANLVSCGITPERAAALNTEIETLSASAID